VFYDRNAAVRISSIDIKGTACGKRCLPVDLRTAPRFFPPSMEDSTKIPSAGVENRYLGSLFEPISVRNELWQFLNRYRFELNFASF